MADSLGVCVVQAHSAGFSLLGLVSLSFCTPSPIVRLDWLFGGLAGGSDGFLD